MTPDHCRAAEIAARFDGLPAGVKKGQLLAAFKQAAAALGIAARLRDAVDTLMSWSQPQDWIAGSRPIIWPSNQRLQDAWQVSRRQVQNILTQLIRLGLISARDSPSGQRWGVRGEDGRIVEAYGLDLSPLAVRHAEFLEAAAEEEQRKKERAALRRRLTIARTAIRQLAETALELNAADPAWRRRLQQLETLCTQPARELEMDTLPGLVEQLDRLQQEALEAFQAITKAVETSPEGAIECTPTATNQLQADQSATGNAAASRLAARPRPGSPPAPSPARRTKPNAATAHLAPGLLARLSPGLAGYLSEARPAWDDVVLAADYLRGELGISRAAWVEACHAMGRTDAAAAVAIIASRRSEIASPGGYLRGMTGRARAGRLNLVGSLWGLAGRVT